MRVRLTFWPKIALRSRAPFASLGPLGDLGRFFDPRSPHEVSQATDLCLADAAESRFTGRFLVRAARTFGVPGSLFSWFRRRFAATVSRDTLKCLSRHRTILTGRVRERDVPCLAL